MAFWDSVSDPEEASVSSPADEVSPEERLERGWDRWREGRAWVLEVAEREDDEEDWWIGSGLVWETWAWG
jgi:hypothetical protein